MSRDTIAPPHWSDALVELNACDDAVAWARTQPDLATAWQACERGDWLLWYAVRAVKAHGDDTHRAVVQAALACAKTAWSRVREQDRDVVQACYDAVEGWLAGTVGDMATVRDAAYAVYAVPAGAEVLAAAYAADAALVREHIPTPPEVSHA